MTPNWKTIINDIEKERAVLLIGQDFFENVSGSTAQDLYNHLAESLDKGVQYFHVQDGLFLFDHPITKATAQQEAEEYYNSLKCSESILTKIIQIPFPLIVSVNPDTLLPQVFSKYKIPFQFDYFSTKNKSIKTKISSPKANRPLIYNLCGTVDDYKSIILDFDDLYDLLKNLLGDFGIPQEINDVLVHATTYIFIGFKFDKWYTQLFLRYVNKNSDRYSNTSNNHAVKTILNEDEDYETTQVFFQKQFNLNIYGVDFKFIDNLYDEFIKNGKFLRELPTPLSEFSATIRRLITVNNIEGALENLDKNKGRFEVDELNTITMLTASYYDWLKKKSDGDTSQENLDIRINKIKNGILELIQKIP